MEARGGGFIKIDGRWCIQHGVLGVGPWWVFRVRMKAEGTEAESFCLLDDFVSFSSGGLVILLLKCFV